MRIFRLPVFILFITFSFISLSSAEEMTSQVQSQSSVSCNQFTFDATSSYDPDNENITVFWDFGDGSTSEESIVTHTYKQSGEYGVTLSITDNSGLECSTAVARQNVSVNIPPIAIFESVDTACTNEEIIFDGSASYDDVSSLKYYWDFGDGTFSDNTDQAQKTYTKGGQYEVTLTVRDDTLSTCNSNSVSKLISINEPPFAEAGEPEILKCVASREDMIVQFDASRTTDSNRDTLTYMWDFGDGSTAKGMKVSHEFPEVGNYDVKLIVKDSAQMSCSTSVDFVKVRLNKTPEANAGEDIVICPGDEVLLDGSNSEILKKGTAISKWNLGDGSTANGLTVAHTYQKPGQYQATLEIANALNAMCPVSNDTKLITVNSTPTVSIKALESTCLGNKVHFDATSAEDPDGDKLEYYWSFGDGTVLRAGSKVSHEYKQGGDYRVTVVVDDLKETTCSTATASTSVKINTPPIADAGPNLSCCVGKEAEFNASASTDPDGDYLTYTWDFGDGTTMNGAVVKHTYTGSGTFNVRLTVDDNSGSACSSSSAGFRAQVNSSPVPIINIR